MLMHEKPWLIPIFFDIRGDSEISVFGLSRIDCNNEPQHDKTFEVGCAPREDSDEPGHPVSLIR